MELERNRAADEVFDRVREAKGALGAALFGLEPKSCMRRISGRETFLVDLADPLAPRPLDVEGDAAGHVVEARLPAVVKRFSSSDAAEARAELLRGKMPRSPAQREAENLAGMLNADLPVPMPYFWCESGARSLVLLEYLPHRSTLRTQLESHRVGVEPQTEIIRKLARLVAHMHAAGWYHRDLYLEHVLLLEDGEIALIDAGRARNQRRPRKRWFVKDLAALASSAPQALVRERLLFSAQYFASLESESILGSPISPPSSRVLRRRFLARVERRAKRMRNHIPRNVHQPASGTHQK